MKIQDNIINLWPTPIGTFYNENHHKIKNDLIEFFNNYKSLLYQFIHVFTYFNNSLISLKIFLGIKIPFFILFLYLLYLPSPG